MESVLLSPAGVDAAVVAEEDRRGNIVGVEVGRVEDGALVVWEVIR